MSSSKTNTSSKSYIGWNDSEHSDTFGFWNSFSNRTFNYWYGNFQENRFLLDTLRNNLVRSVLDVGCAKVTT